jgi:murein DD-endopeptidase MepM/ murein hydrolase activator NlpD
MPAKDAQPGTSLDDLDDSIVEMAMTQEISLELIREYLRKEEEQARQRQRARAQELARQEAEQARARQQARQQRVLPMGMGPIRPDEIEDRRPRLSTKKSAAKPEIAKEPAPSPEEIEAAKEAMRATKAKAKPIKEAKPKPAKEAKPKPIKEAKPKPAKEARPKPASLLQTKPEKPTKAKPRRQEKAGPREKQPKKQRENPHFSALRDAIRLFFWTEEEQDDFWDDETPLYGVPLAHIFDQIYRGIYYFGLRTARPVLLFFHYTLPYILHPILALWHLFRAVALAINHVTFGRLKRRYLAGKQVHDARLERRTGHVGWVQALQELERDFHAIISQVVNTALPLGALLVLLLVARGVSQQTYALQVIYNNHDLGYIANEGVYRAAQEAANMNISPAPDNQGGAADLKTYAQYKFVRVNPEQMTSADRLCDEMLDNAKEKMTSGCGIYVAKEDGSDRQLIAVVKNSTDANWVLETLKEEKTKGMPLAKGAVVGFVQKVDVVPGFYPENRLQEDSTKDLLGILGGNVKGSDMATLREGETLWAMTRRYDIGWNRFLRMNPGVEGNEADFRAGDEFVVSESVPLLQLKVIQTERRKIKIPFETKTTYNSTLYRGIVRIKVKGVQGEDEVFERVTYINGAVYGKPEEISRVHLKDPVTEQREIGRSTGSGTFNTNLPSGNYAYPSATGFIWPAPNCRGTTSEYGVRRGGSYHKGLDIVGAGRSNTFNQVIVAAKDGVVVQAKYTNDGFGNNVVIDHGGGVRTRYAHMNSFGVVAGQRVSAGQPIGRIGTTGNSTGPHLHFEVIINGARVNPRAYVKQPGR